MTVTPRPVVDPRTLRGDPWPEVGTVLLDRYRLHTYVAAGSAAAVWRAHDAQLDRDVAIKLLLPHRAADADGVARFRAEALATVRATHPNAVRVFDACTDGALTFLVMEFVDGPSLASCSLPVTHGVAAALGSQVASALGAAHDGGLVHRDVKPGNVLVDRTGWVKVVDFGIARSFGDAIDLDSPDIGLATARYAAPEVLDAGESGPWSDVYGLGLILWETLVGQPPFHADRVEALARVRRDQDVSDVREHAEVPDDLAEVVTRCTRRDPGERFADGSEAAAALQAVSGPRPYESTRILVADNR